MPDEKFPENAAIIAVFLEYKTLRFVFCFLMKRRPKQPLGKTNKEKGLSSLFSGFVGDFRENLEYRCIHFSLVLTTI